MRRAVEVGSKREFPGASSAFRFCAMLSSMAWRDMRRKSRRAVWLKQKEGVKVGEGVISDCSVIVVGKVVWDGGGEGARGGVDVGPREGFQKKPARMDLLELWELSYSLMCFAGGKSSRSW